MNYKNELQKATDLMAKQGYIFFGQNMRAGGTSMFHMIKHLPESQRIEFPVLEEVQMGASLGMALTGQKVCSIYPRFDFLILGTNQLVNHLDKINSMSDKQWKPKGLIIRTCVGSTKPLMPGEQHCQNHSAGLRKMLKYVKVIELKKASQIVPTFKKAMKSDIPTVIVEFPDLYNKELTKELKESRKRLIR